MVETSRYSRLMGARGSGFRLWRFAIVDLVAMSIAAISIVYVASYLLALPEVRQAVGSAETPASAGRQVSVAFPACTGLERETCVVDGDTIWLEGVKIRIADINAPEISKPHCAAERSIGLAATRRLMQLLNAGPFEMLGYPRDEDKYGRKLRIVSRDGQSLGMVLVAEGLAEEWNGARIDWCA